MAVAKTGTHASVRNGSYALGGLMALAMGSQWWVQGPGRAGLLQQVEKSKRFVRTVEESARRGSILAADGRPLAIDEEAFELSLEFEKVPKSDAFFIDMANATNISAAEFVALSGSGVRLRSWKRPMTKSQADAVKEVKKKWRADGVSLEPVSRRAYPLGEAASGIVGLLREETAVLGLERSQAFWMQGVEGKRTGLMDRNGRFLPMRAEVIEERRDGKDVITTLDPDLQLAASAAIRRAVEENKATNGVALVMDPQTGDLLACANWPSFRPYLADGSPAPIAKGQDLNPAFMAQLEPGSTFKILTLAKALDTGVVDPGRHITCTGVWNPTKRTRIRCDLHNGSRAHGDVSLTRAIAKSCNVAAAQWASRVGYEDFIGYVKELGLLRKSSLGLPGELRGAINEKEPNRPLQLATVGFGQSLTCTPVGLIGAFGMLANGGKRMEPRLIKEAGGIERTPKEPEQVVRPETAAQMLDYMEAVVESDEGTGKSLRIPGYRLSGKTGTAQKIGKDEKGYVSNFVGFVPSREPKAVVLVMVNNPQGGKYYGAQVAGPAFRSVAEAIIHRFAVPPTEPIVRPQKRP